MINYIKCTVNNYSLESADNINCIDDIDELREIEIGQESFFDFVYINNTLYMIVYDDDDVTNKPINNFGKKLFNSTYINTFLLFAIDPNSPIAIENTRIISVTKDMFSKIEDLLK